MHFCWSFYHLKQIEQTLRLENEGTPATYINEDNNDEELFVVRLVITDLFA
jgi:hypothetical protein